MKNILFFFQFFLFSYCFSQTIENVRAEQDGNEIIIIYDINGSSNDQIFSISSFYLIDGNKKEIKNARGDIGRDIKNGKNKKIVWDVLKDVDKIENVEFIVKIDDVYFSKQTNENDKIFVPKRNWMIAFSLNFPHPRWGFIIGRIPNTGKWGYYLSVYFDQWSGEPVQYNHYNKKVISISSIISRKIYNFFHIYSLIALTNEQRDSWFEGANVYNNVSGQYVHIPSTHNAFYNGNYLEYGLGFLANYKSLNINLGASLRDNFCVSFGLGYTLKK